MGGRRVAKGKSRKGTLLGSTTSPRGSLEAVSEEGNIWGTEGESGEGNFHLTKPRGGNQKSSKEKVKITALNKVSKIQKETGR